MSQHNSDYFSLRFSEALRKARGDRSQTEFARLFGLKNQATYQRYEKGKIPAGTEVLFKIASLIGFELNPDAPKTPSSTMVRESSPVSNHAPQTSTVEDAVRILAHQFGVPEETIFDLVIDVLMKKRKKPKEGNG